MPADAVGHDGGQRCRCITDDDTMGEEAIRAGINEANLAAMPLPALLRLSPCGGVA